MEAQVAQHVPRMVPLLQGWIRIPRTHTFKDDDGVLHRFTATNPLDQGGPEASALACISAIPLHKTALMHGKVFGFQDDTYILLPGSSVALCLSEVKGVAENIGTSVNLKPHKSSVWCATPLDLRGTGLTQVTSLPDVMKQPLSIAKRLLEQGFSVSAHACATSLVNKRGQLFDALHALVGHGLPVQVAIALLRTATAGDCTYAQSCHMFDADLMDALDEKLVEATGRLLHLQPAELMNHGQANRQAWFLPFRLGGYGLHSARVSNAPVFLSSWSKAIGEAFQHLEFENSSGLLNALDPIRDHLQKAKDDLRHLGADVSQTLAELIDEPTSSRVRLWKSDIYARTLNTFRGNQDVARNIVLQEASGAGAGAWLQFPT